MSRIYWDTMLFIYWLEDHPKFARRVEAVHSRMEQRKDRLITASFTVGEVLAGCYRQGRPELAEASRKWMHSIVSEILPFTNPTSDYYGRIRATPGVSSADAIHLASAAEAGTDLFLTNDKSLLGKIIPGIQFIASLDTQFF